MFADLSLEYRALKDIIEKKALKPAINRELVNYLTTQFAMSLRQACRILSLSRTVFRYQTGTWRGEAVIQALAKAAERCPRYGFKKQGHVWNHKRVHRIYYPLKLNFRRKGQQRLRFNPTAASTQEALNQNWSIDFMHDILTFGRRF